MCAIGVEHSMREMEELPVFFFSFLYMSLSPLSVGEREGEEQHEKNYFFDCRGMYSYITLLVVLDFFFLVKP